MTLGRIDRIARKLEERMPRPPAADAMTLRWPDLAEHSRTLSRALEGPRNALEASREEVLRVLEDLPQRLEDLPQRLEDLPQRLPSVDLSLVRPARRRGPDTRLVVVGIAIGLAAGVVLGRTDPRRMRRWLERAQGALAPRAGMAAGTLADLGRRLRGSQPGLDGPDRSRAAMDGPWPPHDGPSPADEPRPRHAIEVETAPSPSSADRTDPLASSPR